MEIVIKDLPLFQHAISFCVQFNDECEMKVEGTDIIFEIMDFVHIIMFRYTLIDILEATSSYKIGLNLNDLHALIATMNYNMIKCSLDANAGEVIFRHGCEEYMLKIITAPEPEELSLYFTNLDPVTYPCIEVMPIYELRDLITKALIFDPYIKISYGEAGVGVVFESRGRLGRYLRNESDIAIDRGQIDGSVKINAKDYLEKIVKSFEGMVSLFVKLNHPLKIRYNSSSILFEGYIAPNIEEVSD